MWNHFEKEKSQSAANFWNFKLVLQNCMEKQLDYYMTGQLKFQICEANEQIPKESCIYCTWRVRIPTKVLKCSALSPTTTQFSWDKKMYLTSQKALIDLLLANMFCAHVGKQRGKAPLKYMNTKFSVRNSKCNLQEIHVGKSKNEWNIIVYIKVKAKQNVVRSSRIHRLGSPQFFSTSPKLTVLRIKILLQSR